MTTAIFLDKDGTLIDDVPYNVDPLRIRLARGASEALGIWADQRWPIAIVTNQAGVALGLFTVDELAAVASHLETIIREAVWRKELKHRVGEPGFVQPARTMSAIGG